jgi:large subunit ribosomal protein L23
MNSKLYKIIQKPCLTEKGMMLQELNDQVVMKVARNAAKPEIKLAVEELFNVKVTKIQTINMPGKQKRVGRHIGHTAKWKKAVITLAEGDKIDFLEEL